MSTTAAGLRLSMPLQAMHSSAFGRNGGIRSGSQEALGRFRWQAGVHIGTAHGGVPHDA